MATYDPDPNADWLLQDFTITVVKKKEDNLAESAGEIIVKNTSQPDKPYASGKPKWRWKIYLDTDEKTLSDIVKVEYKLHKTFPNPVRTIENHKTKFALKSAGWGGFNVKIRVFFRDESIRNLSHNLILQ